MKQKGGNLEEKISKKIRKSLYFPELFKKKIDSDYNIVNNIDTKYRKLRKINSKLKVLKNSKKSVRYRTFSTVSKQQQKEVKNALKNLNTSLESKLTNSLSLGDLRVLIEEQIIKRKRELKNEVSAKVYYDLIGILDEMEKKLIEKAKRRFSRKYANQKQKLLTILKIKRESCQNQTCKEDRQKDYEKVEKEGVKIFIDNVLKNLTKKRISRPYPLLSKLKKRKYNKLRSKLKAIENFRITKGLTRVPKKPQSPAKPTRPAPSPQSKQSSKTTQTQQPVAKPPAKPPRPPPPAKTTGPAAEAKSPAKPEAKPATTTGPAPTTTTGSTENPSRPPQPSKPAVKLEVKPTATATATTGPAAEAKPPRPPPPAKTTGPAAEAKPPRPPPPEKPPAEPEISVNQTRLLKKESQKIKKELNKEINKLVATSNRKDVYSKFKFNTKATEITEIIERDKWDKANNSIDGIFVSVNQNNTKCGISAVENVLQTINLSDIKSFSYCKQRWNKNTKKFGTSGPGEMIDDQEVKTLIENRNKIAEIKVKDNYPKINFSDDKLIGFIINTGGHWVAWYKKEIDSVIYWYLIDSMSYMEGNDSSLIVKFDKDKGEELIKKYQVIIAVYRLDPETTQQPEAQQPAQQPATGLQKDKFYYVTQDYQDKISNTNISFEDHDVIQFINQIKNGDQVFAQVKKRDSQEEGFIPVTYLNPQPISNLLLSKLFNPISP